MKALLIALALISTTPFAHAMGDELRNGGRMLACNYQGVEYYQLSDFWEATSLYHYTLNYDYSSADPVTILKGTIERIKRYSPERAALYSTYLESFTQESVFVMSPLEPVHDVGFGVYPSYCESVQVVSQLRTPKNNHRYYIQYDLWNKLSAYHQAGLMLHEFIYREGTSGTNNFKDSIGVRHMNAYIHSTKMGTSQQEFELVTKCAGFKDVAGSSVLNEPCR